MHQIILLPLGLATTSGCLVAGGDVVAIEIGTQAAISAEQDLDSDTGWIDPPPPPPEIAPQSDRKEVTIDPPANEAEPVPQPEVLSPSDAVDPAVNGPTSETPSRSDSSPDFRTITGKQSTPLHPKRDLMRKSGQHLATPIHP